MSPHTCMNRKFSCPPIRVPTSRKVRLTMPAHKEVDTSENPASPPEKPSVRELIPSALPSITPAATPISSLTEVVMVSSSTSTPWCRNQTANAKNTAALMYSAHVSGRTAETESPSRSPVAMLAAEMVAIIATVYTGTRRRRPTKKLMLRSSRFDERINSATCQFIAITPLLQAG